MLRALAVCAAGGTAFSTGCAALLNQAPPPQAATLPPIPMPAHAVQLELLFVERPINDPLLGSVLWTEMDQLAGIPAAQRLALSENGFRFGFCGSQAPPTLAALLAEVGEDAYDDLEGFLTGRRLALRPGATTEVQTTVAARDWTAEVAESGAIEENTFPAARGVLRVKLIGVEDGWAEVRIVPEIHYGDELTQPMPNAEGWQLEQRQRIRMLSETAFSMRMALGELLVLSADEAGPRLVGNQFFRREDQGRLMQRVLVLRIASIDRGDELALAD